MSGWCFSNKEVLALPSNAARAERTLGQLGLSGISVGDESAVVLRAAFGNSPYLARSALQEPVFLSSLLESGPDASLRATIDSVSIDREERSTSQVMADLRRAKRQAALAIALADISGVWPLERVTAALSNFADACVSASLRFLLKQAALQTSWETCAADDLEARTGSVILAMGKYGANELNYSSDIDLIVFYDPVRFPFRKRDDQRAAAVEIVKGLVKLLSEITTDGYVFRVDLRLRPDAGATQVAISTEAAEAYYESMGQNWERAAFIKARACAGDREAAAQFLKNMAPFIWRRNLDYAAIEDIHSIKRQIHAHAGHEKIAVAGHNIKLGRGGIREIEFFVQTLQLILGGRKPNLRQRSTMAALEALRDHGLVSAETAAELGESYRFLRTLEHRLQMVEDEQTHTIPKADEEVAQVAGFMGFHLTDAFEAAVLRHLTAVQENYGKLFEQAPSLSSQTGNLVFTGVEDDPETLATLRRLGFSKVDHIAHAIRGWHHGRIRATRSARARELLTKLVPLLLNALAGTVDADSAFAQFDRFVTRLPAGVQLFSLLLANPELMKVIADICGAAPRFADHLAQAPKTLDALLEPDFLGALPKRQQLETLVRTELSAERAYESKLGVVRRFAREQTFQVAVQVLENRTLPEDAGSGFTNIAEAVIGALIPTVEEEFADSAGIIPGGQFGVVALGRLGGREMTAASDLDLVFIYDAPADMQHSHGPKPLPVSTYYGRLAQRLIAALTTHTAEGGLYEVDMRLRPTGNKGPVAVSLEAFERYHANEAWTWERMALTRARVISAPPALGQQIEAAIHETLTGKRDATTLQRDVREMRRTLSANFPPKSHWDLKFVRGGLIDIEFVAQYLQLREAPGTSSVLDVNTVAALNRLRTHNVLGEAASASLIEAARLQQDLLQVLRIAVEGAFVSSAASHGLRDLLARVTGHADFQALEIHLNKAQAQARQVFEQLLA